MSATTTESPATPTPGNSSPTPPPPARRRRSRLSKEGYRVNWPLTVLMLVASLTIVVPLYFTVTMALKSPAQTGTGSGLEWPNPIVLDNFARAWETTGFGQALMSTAFITVFTVIGAIVASSMVAFSIARNWDRRFFRLSYVYILSAMFIPFPVLILPLIKQTALLGLDNPIGVIFMHVLGGISFFSLLYIAFIRSIPVEIEESARLDGASTWQMFWRIDFPLLGPMNATVGIFAFLQAWNDFLLPQMLIADPALQTLPVVQSLFQGEFNTDFNLAFASYVMALAPTLVVYVLSQRWVLSGVMRGAVK